MRYAGLMTAPQSEPLNARQVRNNAGGFVFAIDDWARLDRFLVLGSDAPTYYQSPRALTREAAACVDRCYGRNTERTVDRIVEISVSGRAPRNDAAIFALALGAVHADVTVRRLALARLGEVCRTATHLFAFVDCARALGRGWGRTLKRAVARWYETRDADALAYQAIKYRMRERYSHRRLLQTAHPASDGPAKDALYQWICGKAHDVAALPDLVRAHVAAMQAETEEAMLPLIAQHRLPWEAVPTAATRNPELWQAMLPQMGLTALVRNLGRMTSIGALTPLGAETSVVAARLADATAIRKARLHPFAILQALAVYRSGGGMRGGLSWTPIGRIVDALDTAFQRAFATVTPSGRRTLIALDVSGSMGSPFGGSPLSVREAAAAMAMVTMRTEPAWHVVAFSQGMVPLDLSAADSLADVVRKTSGLPFDGTDCAQPMLYAARRKLSVDTFIVYTDNETWAGSVHPVEALARYRAASGIAAKLIVVGMTSTGFSIADPDDGGMLDVVGFDASAPAVMADFARA
jgi:60 kDa SS-A/Ro ribonucleoprotein